MSAIPVRLYKGETKLVPFRVRGTDPTTGESINPTTAPLLVGFVISTDGDDAPTSWFSGSWASSTPDTTGSYWGQALVGPSGVTTLAEGRYTPWAQFSLGVETIQEPVQDSLVVT